jgi:hypothetical protein
MAKRLSVQGLQKSPFAELVSLHQAPAGGATSVPESVRAARRTIGKSTDPDYFKLTSYIRRQTHRQVKKRLLDEDKEISQLVEELLNSWLTGQGP